MLIKRVVAYLVLVFSLTLIVMAPLPAQGVAVTPPEIPQTPSCAGGRSLQDPFLNALRKERDPVSIYLVNGIKLQGQIESFDQSVILLKNAVSQMVYKHAISTVVPARNVALPSEGDTTTNGSDPLY